MSSYVDWTVKFLRMFAASSHLILVINFQFRKQENSHRAIKNIILAFLFKIQRIIKTGDIILKNWY